MSALPAAADRAAQGCDPGRHSHAPSRQQIVLGTTGLALLVVGVLIAPGDIPVGPIVLSLGAVVLLFGVALPLVTQIDLGAPLLARVSIAPGERKARLRAVVEDCAGMLAACAANLCPDPAAATRAVQACVSRGVSDWRGTDDAALRTYLLCVLLQQARFETATVAPSDAGAHPFLSLAEVEREVLVLVDRAGLDPASVSGMLGLSVDEVVSVRARALLALGDAGGEAS